jgi:hypothetical protein
MEMLVNLMAVWSILWSFGLFYGRLAYLWQFGLFYGNFVYFMAIWYIFWLFGIFNGHVVYFSQMHQKILATLNF